MENAMPHIIINEVFTMAEDDLITDVQFVIHNLLEKKGVSRSELARRMGISEARVSQIFKDEPSNLTLKTIARIFCALGEQPRLTSPVLEQLMPNSGDDAELVQFGQMKRMDEIAALLMDVKRVDIMEVFGPRVTSHIECNDNEFEDLQLAA